MDKSHPRARTYIWCEAFMSCKFCDLNYVQSGDPGYCQQYGIRFTPDGNPVSGDKTSKEIAVGCKTFVPHMRRIAKESGCGSLRVAIESYEDGGERWYEGDGEA
jgi:hypothetical protein